jgi:hypothetical protein
MVGGLTAHLVMEEPPAAFSRWSTPPPLPHTRSARETSPERQIQIEGRAGG